MPLRISATLSKFLKLIIDGSGDFTRAGDASLLHNDCTSSIKLDTSYYIPLRDGVGVGSTELFPMGGGVRAGLVG
jgi:hypothetical protein